MELVTLETWNFRNLEPQTFEWDQGVNLVLGANGQGKTNLLEAVAVAGNLRSFRTSSIRRLVRHGERAFRLTVELKSGRQNHRLQQIVEIGPPLKRTLTINSGPVDVDQYLSAFPIFALGPWDRELVVGQPEIRRALMDRLAFLLRAQHLSDLRFYRRVLSQRNAALLQSAGNEELSGWETQLAQRAAAVLRSRQNAVAALTPVFHSVYGALRGPSFPDVSISYRTEPWLDDRLEEVEKLYCQRYNGSRARDRKAGFTLEGPHRHDLILRADGRPVRDMLSSGQIKIVAAALRLSTLVLVERDRGEILPLIIDDIDAELDASSVRKLMEWVGDERQVFLSSAHDQGVASEVSRSSRMWIRGGSCDRTEGSGDGS